MARAVEAANDIPALKKCAFWQTEGHAKSGGKEKAEKGKANHAREILRKTLAAHQEAMRDI